VSDAIEIRGLRVMGTHGVLTEEKARPQPFEIDLILEVALDEAAGSDDLQKTVDYGPLVYAVSDLVASERFELLETLAEAIARRALLAERVEAVTVSLRKLRPPIAADVDTVGVRITRRADRASDSG
jgi:7,8-dihydroneopterin aldolase/epimerase/oxygenase